MWPILAFVPEITFVLLNVFSIREYTFVLGLIFDETKGIGNSVVLYLRNALFDIIYLDIIY